VNGQDLRNASHEQAIHAFRQAKDPIIVEVARRDQVPLEANSKFSTHTQDLSSLDQFAASEMITNHKSTAVQTEFNAAEATLTAMAAVALTTEDIRAALSLPRNGIQSSSPEHVPYHLGAVDFDNSRNTCDSRPPAVALSVPDWECFIPPHKHMESED
ncbi:hypothetical protein PHET_03369, partial [Paragonimus heterotremus]